MTLMLMVMMVMMMMMLLMMMTMHDNDDDDDANLVFSSQWSGTCAALTVLFSHCCLKWVKLEQVHNSKFANPKKSAQFKMFTVKLEQVHNFKFAKQQNYQQHYQKNINRYLLLQTVSWTRSSMRSRSLHRLSIHIFLLPFLPVLKLYNETWGCNSYVSQCRKRGYQLMI